MDNEQEYIYIRAHKYPVWVKNEFEIQVIEVIFLLLFLIYSVTCFKYLRIKTCSSDQLFLNPPLYDSPHLPVNGGASEASTPSLR